MNLLQLSRLFLNQYDPTEVTGPASVVIQPAEWDTGVTITMTGVNDDLVDGNIVDTINTDNVSSTDPKYNALTGADVPQLQCNK